MNFERRAALLMNWSALDRTSHHRPNLPWERHDPTLDRLTSTLPPPLTEGWKHQ